MVPRPDVVSLPAGMALRELFAAVATGEHTRYPVHEDGRPDRIVGAVHAKDVMRAVEDAGGLGARTTAGEVMREVLTVPENRRVDDVLQDLKGHRLPRSAAYGGARIRCRRFYRGGEAEGTGEHFRYLTGAVQTPESTPSTTSGE
jgi:CBS domain-containing protein